MRSRESPYSHNFRALTVPGGCPTRAPVLPLEVPHFLHPFSPLSISSLAIFRGISPIFGATRGWESRAESFPRGAHTPAEVYAQGAGVGAFA